MISATKRSPLPPPDEARENVAKPQAAAPAATPGSKGAAFNIRQTKPGDTGFKVCLYGPPKAGKSSLAALAPNPVFLDLNHGLTGLAVNVVDVEVHDFDKLREVIRAVPQFVPVGGTFVIDTVTEVTDIIREYLKGKYSKNSVRELGFDYFPCMAEAFRLLLPELDAVVKAKRNVLVLAHEISANYKNPQGDDYRVLGPNLPHAITGSCQGELIGWVDHLLRIALAEPNVKLQVDKLGKVTGGKVVGGSSKRIITTDGTQSVLAGSRCSMVDGKSLRLPAQFEFESPADDSLWRGLKNPAAVFDLTETV